MARWRVGARPSRRRAGLGRPPSGAPGHAAGRPPSGARGCLLLCLLQYSSKMCDFEMYSSEICDCEMYFSKICDCEMYSCDSEMYSCDCHICDCDVIFLL